MAKARKPNEEALRTEARERTRQMPAETAGGRLDESADMFDEEIDTEHTDPNRDPSGEMRGESRQPEGMTSQMKEKRGNQPPTKPKR